MSESFPRLHSPGRRGSRGQVLGVIWLVLGLGGLELELGGLELELGGLELGLGGLELEDNRTDCLSYQGSHRHPHSRSFLLWPSDRGLPGDSGDEGDKGDAGKFRELGNFGNKGFDIMK